MRAARATLRVGTLIACAVWAVHAEPEAPARTDSFAAIRFLAGSWSGTASGQAGEGTVERSYELVLSGRFLHERNVTSYPAQEKNPRGELHEHWGVFSFDRARDRIVLRQFHQESFVNTYSLDPAASTPEKLVFVSEDFENFDDTWRARETYDLVSPDEFAETFELAAPGKEFEVYSRSRLKRASTTR
jgi:hypothetical protein